MSDTRSSDANLDAAITAIERALSGQDAKPAIESFFDEATNTVSYVVYDPQTREAAVIDSVLDFEMSSGRTSSHSADSIVKFVRENDLKIVWLLETHAHADHLSAAPYLQEVLGGSIAIGDRIVAVQEVFGSVFNVDAGFLRDGSDFDRLFVDGEEFAIGSIPVRVLHVPGHTPACIAYVVGDAVFVGDTMFMPDYGTARADFPGGDARLLYQSIQRILSLPAETRLFLCHDYLPKGRSHYAWETTVAEQRAGNIHVHDGVSEDDFVTMREARDATLDMPQLILPSVQVNMRAGHLPDAEDNGVSYLKLPVNAL